MISGLQLNIYQCELLALTKIPESFRQRESDLFARKWFTYRSLHPVHATYLFAHEYEEAIKLGYTEIKDKNSVGGLRVFKSDDIFLGNTELTNLWKARQRYDALGIRYTFGLRFTIKRFVDRGWHRFPRPNQLYSQELMLDMRDAWAEECRVSLQLVDVERFKTDVQHADVIAYRQWLIKQCLMRAQPHLSFALAINRKLLTLEDIQHVKPDIVAKVKQRIA